MSTRELVETIAEGFGVRPRLLSIPRWMMSLPASLIGKKPVIDRLFSDLEVDASALKRDTGWCPRVSLRDGIPGHGARRNTGNLTQGTLETLETLGEFLG